MNKSDVFERIILSTLPKFTIFLNSTASVTPELYSIVEKWGGKKEINSIIILLTLLYTYTIFTIYICGNLFIKKARGYPQANDPLMIFTSPGRPLTSWHMQTIYFNPAYSPMIILFPPVTRCNLYHFNLGGSNLKFDMLENAMMSQSPLPCATLK